MHSSIQRLASFSMAGSAGRSLRTRLLLAAAGFLAACAVTVPYPLAAATADPHALDQADGKPASGKHPAVSKHTKKHTAPASNSGPKTAAHAAPPQPVKVPPAPPANPVIATPLPSAPDHTPPPAPPPTVSSDAPGSATATSGGLRVLFGSGRADINQATNNALRDTAREALSNPHESLTVLAYAPGPADDPSTARRLSLSRALTIRSALIAGGVPSTRIFVRALGSQSGDGPADRADLVRNATTQAPAQPEGPAAAPPSSATPAQRQP